MGILEIRPSEMTGRLSSSDVSFSLQDGCAEGDAQNATSSQENGNFTSEVLDYNMVRHSVVQEVDEVSAVGCC